LGFEDRAERGQALILADRVEAIAAAGEDLVRIRLVPYVPEDLVARGVEEAVERHRQLAGAEVGAEVTADLADHVDDLLPDLLGDPLQLRVGKAGEIAGRADRVEQARLRRIVVSAWHQVCRVWMKSVIRIRSSVCVGAPSRASRAFR